jgi:uncharacterized Zn finger protein (UPF0148 family)
MSKCPECGTYSELRSSMKGLMVCPSCKAMFPEVEVPKKRPLQLSDAFKNIDYLQQCILELGKTNTNLMKEISKNRKEIEKLKRTIK